MAAADSPDLVVLGAGSTGLGAARAARAAGARVVLVEAGRPGGDCTHYGCVPSKALLESARRVAAARSGDRYGFSATVEVDFPAVMERVAAVVREVEQDESPELLASEGIELVRGWGRFTGPRTLEVLRPAEEDGHAAPPDGSPVLRTLTCDRFVVATGSVAAVPPIDGLDAVPHLDNRTVFDLRAQPEHLLVLGGGPIGVELAQAFRRLGSAVTVVQSDPDLVPRDEPEARAALARVLGREGVDVRTGARATAVRGREGDVALELADGSTVAGSHLLVAVGRRPSTSGFGLEATSARLDERGRVAVDRSLRAARTVWAAGDCASPLLFTHVGDAQGRLAAGNALAGARFWRRGRWDDRVVPWVTYTEPEVAHVGLSEAEAFARYGDRARVSVMPTSLPSTIPPTRPGTATSLTKPSVSPAVHGRSACASWTTETRARSP